METATIPVKKEITPLQKISNLMNGEGAKKKFADILGSRAPQFIASVMSAVNTNKLLHQATPESVYGAATMAATIDLPVVSGLGYSYIIPYNTKTKDEKGRDVYVNLAQYQIGAKGFIQLAMRSGQYLKITVNKVYEGELTIKNRFTEEFEFGEKKSDKVVGYLAYFRLVNGMEKYLYMTNEELEKHAIAYSIPCKRAKALDGKWKDDFESMAMKTVIKQLLSKYGILSVEMKQAIVFDQGVKKGDSDDIEYVDAVPVKPTAAEQAEAFIEAEEVKEEGKEA